MAAKIKMLKLLQELRGFAEMSKRRPPPRLPALLLAQMRSHVLQATLPRRRLSVRTDVQELPGIPHPVKINHVKQSLAARVTPPSP